MAFTKIESDGMYPLNNDMNTESTTIYVGDLGGATVSIGHKDPDGNWNPFPNGTLTSHTPLSISHGYDVLLMAIAINVSGEINIETKKEGVGGIQGLLMQIEENTASPIKVDAPAGVPSVRQEGEWVEGVTREEVDSILESRAFTVVFGNDNTTPTTTDDEDNYVLANTTTLTTPASSTNVWTYSPTAAIFTYTGTGPTPYEIIISGTVDSDSTTNTGHINIRLREPSGIMTGTNKRYSAGRTQGSATSKVGFTSVGFGSFSSGDQVQIEISKDFNGNLFLEDLIIAFKPL